MEATFSHTYPASEYDIYNFITDEVRGPWDDDDELKPKIYTIGKAGAIASLDQCKEINPPYKPMFFPSSAVHIAYRENYTLPRLKVELMFRTVISDQTLANYTARDGSKIQFRLDRKGRVSIILDIKQNTIILETSKENYHDGEWHSTSFDIDSSKTDQQTTMNTISFSADKKTRLAPIAHKFTFNGWVNIGFGFTGCMRDVKVLYHL